MNEEEKQAIEKFENLLTKHFENKKIDTLDYLDYFEGITILNLIEKQQKEIESRLKEIDSLYKMMLAKDDEIETLKESQFVLYGHDGKIAGCIKLGNDVISKDKIKEKIKYYHKQREKAETEKINDMFVNYIDCLEELLQGGQESDQEGGQEDE